MKRIYPPVQMSIYRGPEEHLVSINVTEVYNNIRDPDESFVEVETVGIELSTDIAFDLTPTEQSEAESIAWTAYMRR